MTETQLYAKFDEMLGPVLETRGFHREEPARYCRCVVEGEEFVSVSKGPPSKARTHFSVWISFHPHYMQPIDEIFNLSKWDRGSLTPPYLTPVGTTFRPKYWNCSNEKNLQVSLQHVIKCLEDTGFAWLESLRQPIFFASKADPTALLPYALAHEVAGNFRQAHLSYQSALDRLRKVLALFEEKTLPESEVFEKYAKPFVFVAAKLGVEKERASYFRQKVKYEPDIREAQ